MFGTILIAIGTFFEEISDSIGKVKVTNHEESKFTMAFLTLFWGAILFALISIFKHDAFIFKLASLPTFFVRVIFELIQMYTAILAIVVADRSTFSFGRTLTIPLLLIVDAVLGYKIGILPIAGIAIIMITLLILFSKKSKKQSGIGWVIISAIGAVGTISLFKYDITHYNSIVAEQLIMTLILLLFSIFFAFVKAKENPFKFLKKPIFFFQSLSTGLGGIIVSFSYNYGAASIITAAKRGCSILWALLSGKIYFKEKNIILKIAIFILLLTGLALLTIN